MSSSNGTTNGRHVHHLEMEPDEDHNDMTPLTSSVVGSGSPKRNNRDGVIIRAMESVMEPSNQRNIIYIACGILAIAIIVLNIDGVDISPLTGNGGGGGGASASANQQVEFIDPSEVEIITPQEEPPNQTERNGNNNAADGGSSHVPDLGEPITADPVTPQQQQPKEPETPREVVPKPRLPKVPMLDPDIQRGPIPQEKEEYLRGKWGGWHFWDGDVDNRPNDDYVHQHPNGDIPGDQFPDNAWQLDAVYVNHYLDSASDLVQMAMEAIYTEYGWAKSKNATVMAERIKMFHWDRLDLATQETPPEGFGKRGARETGGWTTKRSFDGLIRRLIHAMITQDTFTVVLAGHSAAQGEGNHFRQSYMMQFHQIMKPVFERLGVKLITRNLSYGGMGTIQTGMAGGDILGHEIDLLLWDAGMTENCCPAHIDLFFRQALLGGNRVPVIWASGPFELLRIMHETFDVDVGEFGTGMYGITPVQSEEQANTEIPYAARFLKCSPEATSPELCTQDRFDAKCWIDRDDGIKPQANQRDRPKGQVKWHPGWRAHQLQGRVLAFAILEAIEVACNRWMDGTMTGQPLDDSYWHVTEYYENIRNKIREQGMSVGKCPEIEEQLPKRMCVTPMKGRTQYTPRADYERSSLASIVQPAPDGYFPTNTKTALYDGPDVHNPVYDLPDDAVDVLAIVMNRRRQLSEAMMEPSEESLITNSITTNETPTTTQHDIAATTTTSTPLLRHRQLDSITPGKGWEIFDEPQGLCDGTYDATCAHSTDNECFLIGHHAARGAIVGTEWSGWLVMKLEALKEGIIVIKLHTWHYASENPRTESWTSENGERRRRRLLQQETRTQQQQEQQQDRRQLDGESCSLCGELSEDGFDATAYDDDEEQDQGRRLGRSYDTPELPDTFVFEYAIDGQITSLNKDKFLEKKQQLQRVVETWTLLDDPNFIAEGGAKTRDVEVAIRLKGVERKVAFGVSHIYWA